MEVASQEREARARARAECRQCELLNTRFCLSLPQCMPGRAVRLKSNVLPGVAAMTYCFYSLQSVSRYISWLPCPKPVGLKILKSLALLLDALHKRIALLACPAFTSINNRIWIIYIFLGQKAALSEMPRKGQT